MEMACYCKVRARRSLTQLPVVYAGLNGGNPTRDMPQSCYPISTNGLLNIRPPPTFPGDGFSRSIGTSSRDLHDQRHFRLYRDLVRSGE